MPTPSAPNNNDRRARWRERPAYAWHRRIGVGAAVLFLFLIVTGLLLNHAGRLGLDSRYLQADWVLAWYGVAPRGAPVSYPAGDHWVTGLDRGLYLDGRLVAADAGELKGALATKAYIVAATSEALLLLATDGALIERMNSASLPGPIRRLGPGGGGGGVVVQSADGRYASDPDILSWRPVDDRAAWVEPAAAPQAIEAQVLNAYRGRGLSWERVLLDLHSGRILGPWGPYLMDAAALCLLLLVVTGLYNWVKRKP